MTPATVHLASTSLLAGLLLLSAGSYTWHAGTIEGVRALGFPDFFRIQLAVMKTGAAVLLMWPSVPLWAKEWVYGGVLCFLVTAIVAHTAHKDPPIITLVNLGLIALVLVSHQTSAAWRS